MEQWDEGRRAAPAPRPCSGEPVAILGCTAGRCRRIWHDGGGGFGTMVAEDLARVAQRGFNADKGLGKKGDEPGDCCQSCMVRPQPGHLRGHPQECQGVPSDVPIMMPMPVPWGIVLPGAGAAVAPTPRDGSALGASSCHPGEGPGGFLMCRTLFLPCEPPCSPRQGGHPAAGPGAPPEKCPHGPSLALGGEGGLCRGVTRLLPTALAGHEAHVRGEKDAPLITPMYPAPPTWLLPSLAAAP